MSKIFLIIEREYKTRVMKPAFIILTFLMPLLIVGMIMVPLWLASFKDDSVKKILVVDKSGLYSEVFQNDEIYNYEYQNVSFEGLRDAVTAGDFIAVVYIEGDLTVRPGGATIYAEQQIGVDFKSHIKNLLNEKVENQKMLALNVPDLKELVEKTRADVDLKSMKWDKDGTEKTGSAELSLVVGMITAFVIYMFIVIYGAQLMQGVVQEKTSRIVEVIVSSVRPFELMMGKIIGIAMVGLTQFLLWVVLSVSILLVVGQFIPVNQTPVDPMAISGMSVQSGMSTDMAKIQDVMTLIHDFDFLQTGILFVIYFLGGYLLYASLFAAVGSAVDNETDTQQFTMPVMLPIIFAIYAAIYSAENPDGPLAFWCSMIPFTSPIVMMVRLPFDVPFWQLALSIGILILSFIGTTWLAGKIYRTGILMYGKKVSWKEMIKWLKY